MQRVIALALFVLVLVPPVQAAPNPDVVLGAELLADGLVAPLGLVASPDDTGRLFILDETGVIYIMRDGVIQPQPFLDLRDRIIPLLQGYDERGLLGLAFHPQFAQNGRFFVKYSEPLREGAPPGWDHTNVLSEFALMPGNPDQGDPNSERKILEIDHPQLNHNSGPIHFGPDGYLYLAEGDGGGANDVGEGHTPTIGNGQDLTKLLGKFMRIDIDSGSPYGIPPDNPFVNDPDALDEIWAYGFRNPYGWSFDMGGDHRLFVGDAGQNMWEEADIVDRGQDYGWNIREGFHCFDPAHPDTLNDDCPHVGYRGEPLIDPILQFPNTANQYEQGLSVVIVGGNVYRGTAMPDLEGAYIFGGFSRGFDRGNGSIFVGREVNGTWTMEEARVYASRTADSNALGRLNEYVRGFGQDLAGEIYVLTSDSLGPAGTTGKVFRIGPAPFPGGRNEVAANRTILSAVLQPAIASMGLDLRLTQDSPVDISVFDVSGRHVRTLVHGAMSNGSHQLKWDGRSDGGALVPSGVYFYRFRAGDESSTQHAPLIR